MVKGFSKMYNLSFFGQIIFRKHFYNITGFCDKKFNFCKFSIFFLQILKVKHKSFPVMYHLSYLDIKHGFRGRVKLTPSPQHILVFKYPSRDRVNLKVYLIVHKFILQSIVQQYVRRPILHVQYLQIISKC